MPNNYFEELVQKTLKLVSYNTVQDVSCNISPFGEGVGRCLQETENICKSLGFKTHNEHGYYVTAEIGEGKDFGILGHIDTVPFEPSSWIANPLGEIKNGVLFGRGVLDDKGPMLACLYAVKKLIDEGRKPKYNIKFIFGGNEESGWKCIERYNQVDIMPELGISPDADFPVINCEKGIVEITALIDKPESLVKVKGGSRSNVVIDSCLAVVKGILPSSSDINVSIEKTEEHTYIKTYGKSAHGSTPEKGDNAFHHLLHYLAECNSSDYAHLSRMLCNIDGSGLGLKLHDDQSGDLTFNIGVVDVVDNKLKLVMDIRYPISYTKENILSRINFALNTNATITHFHDPLYLPKDDPLIVSLLSAYNNITGENEEPITIGGGTYARALKHGVAFGPIFPNQESTIHQSNERVSLIDFEKTFNIYYEALKFLFE